MNRKSIAPLLIALSLAAPGCKSGWKMPSPSNMWPWNRQPSAETLAGTPPKPTLETPAPKHTPTAIASTAAAGGSKSATSMPGTTVSYPTPQQLGGGAPSKPTYGAANLNGYQNGPYGMSGQGSMAVAPNTPAVPNSASTGYPQGSNVPPNVYAGTGGLPSDRLPPSATPNTASAYTPALPSAQTSPQVGYSMPNATPPSSTSMPSYQPSLPNAIPGTSTVGYAVPVPSQPQTPGALPSNPPIPFNTNPVQPLTPNSAQGGPTAPLGVTPMPAMPSGDGYRPGSTNRPNTYSFPNATVPVNSHNSSPTNTAGPASSGYGSFNVPPYTATTPAQPTVR